MIHNFLIPPYYPPFLIQTQPLVHSPSAPYPYISLSSPPEYMDKVQRENAQIIVMAIEVKII
jgi:hypothetical protein